MHKTFAHISAASEADINLPSLLTLAEAHAETWEAVTTEPQTYATTIEFQEAGVDLRWVGGRRHLTEAGTLAVFASGTRVEAEEIAPGPPARVTYIRLQGPLAAAIECSLAVTTVEPLILADAPASLCATLAEAARIIFDRPPDWPWKLVEALAQLAQSIDRARRRSTAPASRLADRVRSLVEESPQRSWSVKEMAALLGVRRESLWQQFKEQTGQSPGDWIRQHRVRVAQALLSRGLSVRETAARLGFSSRQQFARTYRTVTGRAPTGRA